MNSKANVVDVVETDNELFNNWLVEKFEAHGLVGLVRVKGFDPDYRDLVKMLEEAGVDHGFDAVYKMGLGNHIDQIFEMACDGCTSTEIADALGAKTKTVSRFCNRHGIWLDKPAVVADFDGDIRLYAERGWTVKQMADEMPFAAGSIACYARANGIAILDPMHVGFITDHAGYVLDQAYDHPNRDSKGYVRRHRLVMENHLGRYLEKKEVVHHIDGNKQNNELSNLELTTLSKHASEHARNGETGWAVYHRRKQDIV